MSSVEGVVVGLGNPGPRYAITRHNAGFILLDLIAQDAGVSFKNNRRWKADACEVSWRGHRILLLKPMTFMNLSGESLQGVYAEHAHLRDKPLIVAHDEVDIPSGELRVKKGGGDAGHNGLKSIRAQLGHGDYLRLRLGVGRPPAGSPIDMADYVLMNFARDESETVGLLMQRAADSLEALLGNDFDKAQRIAAAR